RTGSSRTHGSHHVAHTLSSTTWPRWLARLTSVPSSDLVSNAGAGPRLAAGAEGSTLLQLVAGRATSNDASASIQLAGVRVREAGRLTGRLVTAIEANRPPVRARGRPPRDIVRR